MLWYVDFIAQGEDWERKLWQARRILRVRGGFESIADALGIAIDTALAESDQRKIVLSAKWFVKIRAASTIDPKEKYLEWRHDQAAMRPLNLVWQQVGGPFFWEDYAHG